MTKEEQLKYWTDYSFKKLDEEKTIMPLILKKVLIMNEFINSEVSEKELRKSIKERFRIERENILNESGLTKDDFFVQS